MGHTNSGSGKQNIAIGKHAVAEQTNTYNYNAPSASPDELLKLLAEIKARLPELPDKAQVKLRNAVEEVEMEAQEAEPDREEITAALTRAQKVLAAIPSTVKAALPVGELIGKALAKLLL
ncbi:hypothetical protein GCAAIG_06795 [Candidatus Electronema halotolerans]